MNSLLQFFHRYAATLETHMKNLGLRHMPPNLQSANQFIYIFSCLCFCLIADVQMNELLVFQIEKYTTHALEQESNRQDDDVCRQDDDVCRLSPEEFTFAKEYDIFLLQQLVLFMEFFKILSLTFISLKYHQIHNPNLYCMSPAVNKEILAAKSQLTDCRTQS
jgi:hypothetical protein